MNSPTYQLSALQRATSTASKMLVAGSVAGLTSGLIVWLLARGVDVGEVGVGTLLLPAPFAAMVFGATSVGQLGVRCPGTETHACPGV